MDMDAGATVTDRVVEDDPAVVRHGLHLVPLDGPPPPGSIVV